MTGLNAANKAREFEAQDEDNVNFGAVANMIDNAPDDHCLLAIALNCDRRAAKMRSKSLGDKYREVARQLRNEVALSDEDDEPEVFDPTDPMSRLYENEVPK